MTPSPNRAIAMLLLCSLAIAGCAGPGAGWANFKDDRAIAKAAADDSFPSAAQAGVAAGTTADIAEPAQ